MSSIPEIKGDLEGAIDTLLQNPKIPEYIFVERFIPYLKGEIKEDPDFITDWIRAAGGITNSVDVVDNENKVLYTVPPLIQGDFTDIGDQRDALPSIMKRADELERDIPGSGKRLLDQVIPKVANVMSEISKSNKEQIRDIVNRYKTSESTDTINEVEDFLDYDS